MEYRIGYVTDAGDEISHIFGHQGDTIVFENTKGQLRWCAVCDNEIYIKSTNKYNYLSGKIPSTLPENLKNSITSDLAIALHNSFISGDPNNVDVFFKQVEERISSILSPNQAKLWLILFSLLSSVILILFLFRIFIMLDQNDSSIVLCSGAGVLGSLMSLMQRNSNITINLEDGKPYIFMQASFIPLLGLFSGLCLYFLSNSDLAFSFAKENVFNLLVLSVVAGFSERFVPDLFNSASTNLTSKGSGR